LKKTCRAFLKNIGIFLEKARHVFEKETTIVLKEIAFDY